MSWRTGSISTSLHTKLRNSAWRSLSSLWRWVIKSPSLQIIKWSTVKASPQAHVEGISSTGQSYRSLTASRNSLLFGLKPKSWRGNTVSHADDPLPASRSCARWVFLGAISLIRSALYSSSFNLSLIASCCANFVRESSGNWFDWDTICSTRGFVSLKADEAYSRLASRDGSGPAGHPSERTGSARIFLCSL